MSSAPPPSDPPSNEKPLISVDDQENARSTPDAMEVTPEPPAETWEDLPPELLSASAEEINSRMRLIDNEIRVGRFASRSRAVGGVNDAYAFAGNALRNAAATARGRFNEGESTRKRGQDQAEQGAPVSC